MTPHEEDAVVRRSVSVKDARSRFWLKIIGVVFLLSLFGGGAAALATYLSLKSTAQDGTQLAQDIQMACDSDEVNDPQLEQFCPTAAEVVDSAPNAVLPDPPEDGVDGQNGTDGTDGEDGTDGTDGSDSTVAGPRGLQGLMGLMGLPGADGEDSTVPGPQGPPGEDGQDSIVPGPQGPAGRDGTDGEDGTDGRDGSSGLVSVVDECSEAPEGQVVSDVNASYDASTFTITLNCTYRPDQVGGILTE